MSYCCLVTKSCPSLLQPHDHSLPVSSVHGISQARIPEWVVISSSRGSPDSGIEPAYHLLHRQTDSLPLSYQQSMSPKLLCCVRLFVIPWTVTGQAPQSMRFFRQEYWSGLPCTPPEDLPDQGLNPWIKPWDHISYVSCTGRPSFFFFLPLAPLGKPWATSETIYNPCQITHDVFHRTRANNPKFSMEPNKTKNCLRNHEGKE